MIFYSQYEKLASKGHKLPYATTDFQGAAQDSVDTLPAIFGRAGLFRKEKDAALLSIQFMAGMRMALRDFQPS